MLEYLRISDLALIADMELEFGKGMNVLTGETGAGKSFVLKAISFLMGDKMNAKMVRPRRERALVEAMFNLPDGEQIIRRELFAETGRSRLFINGNLSSQEILRELRPQLILHTSQHGHQRLLQPAFQSRLLDDWMQRPDLLETSNNLLKQARDVEDRLRDLHERSTKLADRRELLEMHKASIDQVKPLPDEDTQLETIRQKLRLAAQSRKWHERIMQIIHDNEDGSLKSRLSVLDQALNALSADDPNLAEYVDALRQFRSTLDELTRNLNKPPLHNINADEVESRLFALSQLKRKLNRSLPEILTLRDEIEETVSFLDSCGLDIKQAEKERNQILEKLAESLDILNEQRKKAADGFCSALKVQLEALGFMDHVRVLAEFTPHTLAPGCIEERCRFLWAPNPGQAPQPLDHIASGGELSRFLLAVITLQAQHEDATLIFDEIDAGVGGITLNRVAEALSELADKRQMLLITHWPQLAARAKAHFQVNKEVIDNETFTRCIRLDGAAREVELARMAGIEN